jgi:hypothetical protein
MLKCSKKIEGKYTAKVYKGRYRYKRGIYEGTGQNPEASSLDDPA